MSEKVVKFRRKEEELQEAFVTLANQVQALQDTVLLLNLNLTAVVQILEEGRPITKSGVEKRAQTLLRQLQEEWSKLDE
ncbi:hypothetical protein ACOJUR_12220 [Alicyclobacillus tolerans]|uniref:hypothetical protein n=1 Tax=Alicyclobacillus tolerans TaxID=90970 RepID=UPI003B7D941C